MKSLIQHIETLSYNAWPTTHTLFYDGWIIRLANGYTKRANSVNPIYASKLDVELKISYCADLFNQHKLNSVFKLTAESFPTGIDQILKEKGYKKIDETSVQIYDIPPENNTVLDEKVSISQALHDNWIEEFCRLNSVSPENQQKLCQILERIILDHWFYMYESEGKIIACGLGVLQDDYYGIFDIIVDPLLRGKGVGTTLISSMIAHAKEMKAKKAYLQVVKENLPAIQLYQKIGFKELYTYWYRRKSLE